MVRRRHHLLQPTVRAAENLTGCLSSLLTGCLQLPPPLHTPSHPSHGLFSPLPSGTRLQSLRAKANRPKDSFDSFFFFHQALKILNSLLALPPEGGGGTLHTHTLTLHCDLKLTLKRFIFKAPSGSAGRLGVRENFILKVRERKCRASQLDGAFINRGRTTTEGAQMLMLLTGGGAS